MGDILTTTVTLNTAMDRTLVVPNFQYGRRHRASDGVTLPGGRGIVIARTLKTLGFPVIATGFAGGLTGANVIERLTAEGLLNDFVRIAEPSRTSTAVIDPISGSHTEINEYGPRILVEECDLLLEKLRYLTRASGCVIIAGSLPRDVPADMYQRIIRSLQGREILGVVCAPDDVEALGLALQADPYLTVVEQREAEDLVGNELNVDEDFVEALDSMGRRGGQYHFITTEHGCYVRLKDRKSKVESYWKAVLENADTVSNLGCSDVIAAVATAHLSSGREVADVLKRAVATAQANSRMLGAGVFDKADVQRFFNEVEVVELAPVAAVSE